VVAIVGPPQLPGAQAAPASVVCLVGTTFSEFDWPLGGVMHKAFRFLLFLVALKAIGQTFQGSLAGIVTDGSNAAIPAATIRLETTTNGLRRSAVSTTSSIYLFPELPVGIYTLAVTAKGFQDKKVENIEIAVSKTTDLNVRLDVSQVSASVDVTASPVALETTSSALVSVMDSKIVTDIPINGRDYRQMFLLAPGVAGVNSPNNTSLNGTRTEEINYQLDGVDNNNHGKPLIKVSVACTCRSTRSISCRCNRMPRRTWAATREATSTWWSSPARTPCTAACTSSIATRRWRRTRRCSPRELRNRKFATISSALRRAGPSSETRRSSFMNGEEQLAVAANSLLETSPSAAWVAQATAVLQEYGVALNPVSMNLLTYWPAESRIGPATTNNWLSNTQNKYESYNSVVRVDHHFNDRHSIFGRYAGGYGWQSVDAGSHFQEFFQVVPGRVHNFGVVEADEWSPRLLNQVTVAVTASWRNSTMPTPTSTRWRRA
jgi:hypothetical protein